MSRKYRPVPEIKHELGEAIAACMAADKRQALLRNELAEATVVGYAGLVCLFGWDGEGVPTQEVVPLSRITNSWGAGLVRFSLSSNSTVWIEVNGEQPVPLEINENWGGQEAISLPFFMVSAFRLREHAVHWALETAQVAAAEHRVGLELQAESRSESAKHTLH